MQTVLGFPMSKGGVQNACMEMSEALRKPVAALGRWVRQRKESVYRFLFEEGVEPTNNAAEQAVRAGVMWRRKSQGTRSEEGSDFVGRLLSVGATCRQQGREV